MYLSPEVASMNHLTLREASLLNNLFSEVASKKQASFPRSGIYHHSLEVPHINHLSPEMAQVNYILSKIVPRFNFWSEVVSKIIFPRK